jgi:hypothetical protein
MLLVLENVDYTLINIDDFVTYDFVWLLRENPWYYLTSHLF